MNYCVLVHISKSTISFWYQQEGTPFEPLSQNEGNVLPLYFYANENDFILGTNARERFLNGDQVHAFGNYFDIITNPANFFNVYGNKKHVKFLLYYAVEQYLSHFINSVLYKNESIEGYRNNFPLRFVFSQDIAPKEKLLVESIFKESGYDNISSISYSKHLFEHLFNNGVVNKGIPAILLTGIDGNLYVELFSKSFENSDGHLVLEDEGADPRIKIMAKMIYDDAMGTTRMNLNEKAEIAHLIPYALDFLSQDSAIPKGDVTLSDGTTCWVKLKRKDLDDRLLYYEGDSKIYKSIEKLVSVNNIPLHTAQIVLHGDSINTSFFLERLLKKFSHVAGVPHNTEYEVIKLLFQHISKTGYVVQNLPPVASSPTATSSVPPVKTVAPPISASPPVAAPPIRPVPSQIVTPPPAAAPPPRAVPPPPVRAAPPHVVTPPPVAAPPPRAVPPPPSRTAPPPVAVPPPRAVPPPPSRTAPPPVATPPPRASVPPHIVAPSVKATPPPPPPPPPKASTAGGSPDLEVVDNNSMVILRYKVKSLGGEELKSTKLKKTDFGKIVELVKSGSKLSAVNSLKEKTGLSLKSAKDIIDSIKIK